MAMAMAWGHTALLFTAVTAVAAVAAVAAVHAAPPNAAECERALVEKGIQLAEQEEQLRQLQGRDAELTAETARLAAELAAANRKTELLTAQIRLVQLVESNNELRAELGDGGADASDVARWLCEKGVAPSDGTSCDELLRPGRPAAPAAPRAPGSAAAVRCDSIQYVPSRSCGGPDMRKATHAELAQCPSACALLPQWGIASGADATLSGKGYKCALVVGRAEHGLGESLCIAGTAAEPAPAEPTAAAVGQQRSGGGEELAARRAEVVQMMKDSWDSYAAHAWGENELRPCSKRGVAGGIFGNTQMGSTVVDALDTLLLMGLDSRAEAARAWIEKELTFNHDESVSVFEVTIRYVGGLLSAHAMTGDELYKTTAVELATRLLPAFDTPTGLPKSTINLQTGATKNWGWSPASGNAILSELGGLQLEFEYLSELSGDPRFRDVARRVTSFVVAQYQTEREAGELPVNFINTDTGSWHGGDVSVGAFGDSFYEYLLKVWLRQGGSRTSDPDPQARRAFDLTVASIRSRLHRRTGETNTLYIADAKGTSLQHHMWHLSCFIGGTYALAGMSAASLELREQYLADAADVTATCRQAYAKAAAGLGPEKMEFNSGRHEMAEPKGKYILRPETVESYFYMWRATKDPKYREWAWEALGAIKTRCQCDGGGFSGIVDVGKADSAKDDVQQSFFLAETLKYLYLIFSDDDVLPLDRWVFNTEAHPIPVARALASA